MADFKLLLWRFPLLLCGTLGCAMVMEHHGKGIVLLAAAAYAWGKVTRG